MTIRLDHLMQLADRAMMGVPHVNASESLLLLRYLTDEQREHARICYATLIGERTVPLEFNAGRARPAVSPAMRRAPPRYACATPCTLQPQRREPGRGRAPEARGDAGSGERVSTDLVIAKLDAARLALAEARTLQDTKKILDVAAAAEIYARRQKLSDENIAFANEVKVEALRQLGAMLAEQKAGEGMARPGPKNSVPDENRIPTLEEAGIDKKTSMTAQRLAALPPEKYEAVKTGKVSIAKATATPKPNAAALTRSEPVRPAPAAAPEPDEDDLLESMRRRIGQLNDQLAALAQDDVQAELRKQMALRVAIEERLSDTMNTNARLNSELRAFGKWQMDLFRATGVETRAEVLRMARAWRGSQEEAA